MIAGQATAKYIRTSAQKAGLVLDLIRGGDVNRALAALKFSRKKVARDIEKVLRSAIANAQQKPGFSGDVERLYVSACYAGQGPSQKRVRPAPMGRAYRVVKRTAHLTVAVAERPEKKAAPAPPKGDKAARGAAAAEPRAPRARKSTKTGGASAAKK
jgi:large subunit ribosomal protein L22